MPLTPDSPHDHSNVMIVDDNPANLKLLEDTLIEHGYEVRSFPRGRMALTAAEQEPPDLILLDINMPEMNGYEVCEQLKSHAKLSGVPVIFLSALSATEDKVKGFSSGGVDYISKPFQLEEVQARVETQIKLRHAQQAMDELLEKTLGGAVETLWGLIQISSPLLASRSQAIRDIVRHVVQRTGIKNDSWQYELAATLCLVGCIALPDEVFEKGYSGHALTPDESRIFHAHPETGASLVMKIPRLETVGQMIRNQQRSHAESAGPGPAQRGARMLHLALELDRKIYRGTAHRTAVSELRSSNRFETLLLAALEGYIPAGTEFDLRNATIRELRAGMVLDQDLFSSVGGLLILKAGTVLNPTWIERLENFSKTRGSQESIKVRVPKH
jgi:DNA-binding response OmpR family regulator